MTSNIRIAINLSLLFVPCILQVTREAGPMVDPAKTYQKESD